LIKGKGIKRVIQALARHISTAAIFDNRLYFDWYVGIMWKDTNLRKVLFKKREGPKYFASLRLAYFHAV